jgi:hypothetical protein
MPVAEGQRIVALGQVRRIDLINRATEHALHERVLMRFVQSNIKRPAMEKRTGERVIIEEIDKADRPLIYASELAEQQIKHEMIEANENVY